MFSHTLEQSKPATFTVTQDPAGSRDCSPPAKHMAYSSGPLWLSLLLPKVPHTSAAATSRVLVGSTSEKHNRAEAPCWPGHIREDRTGMSPALHVTSAGSQRSYSCASAWQSQSRQTLWAPSLCWAPESVGTGYVTFYWNKIKPISFCQQALTSWRVKRLWDPIDLTNTALLVNLHLSFSFLSTTVLSTTHFLRGYIPISNPPLTYEVSNSNLLESPI